MKFTAEALKKAHKLFDDDEGDAIEYIQSLEKLKGSNYFHVGNGIWAEEDMGYILKAVGDVITAVAAIYEPHCFTYCKAKNILLVCATDESIVYDGDTLKKLCDANYD